MIDQMYNASQKEKDIINNLIAQEKLCMDKYNRIANEAKDPVLKDLFVTLGKDEAKHHDMLQKLLEGQVSTLEAYDVSSYNPVATYVGNYNESDKQSDNFLCTDTITTEKYVSTAYNFNLFQFADSNVRKLLNNIETEEQNHAEMINKYKTVNQMTN